MNPFSILMFIFAIAIFLGGVSVYTGNRALLWRAYHAKVADKKYLRYVGRVTMLTSLAPVASGIVALLGDEDKMMAPAGITLVLVFIITIVFGIKVFNGEE